MNLNKIKFKQKLKPITVYELNPLLKERLITGTPKTQKQKLILNWFCLVTNNDLEAARIKLTILKDEGNNQNWSTEKKKVFVFHKINFEKLFTLCEKHR